MRVLMLTWEYPPRVVGGIARHAEELSEALVRGGHAEVHVVTCAHEDAPAEEVRDGVHIYRVAAYDAPGGYRDFLHWIHQLNAAMHDRAAKLIEGWQGTGGDPVLLHAHDWLAHFSAARLKHGFRLPLVATVHATESGRRGGIHEEISRYIDRVERDLTTEAWRVIACSHYMHREVHHALQCPWDKVDVIPNGIDASKFDFPFPADEAAAFRAQYAAPYEKIVMFVGRPAPEKGAQVLIGAMPAVRRQWEAAKLVICGGGDRSALMGQAWHQGVGHQVMFTGFIGDAELLRLYRVADCACFPSLYEPFGIVALEAMAAGTPVVVSDAGGLPEVVEHDVTGTVVWANSSDSTAWGISRVFREPAHAMAMAEAAKHRIATVFNWDVIAAQTVQVYKRVWGEYSVNPWRPQPPTKAAPPRRKGGC